MPSFEIGEYRVVQTSLDHGYGYIMVFNASSGTVTRARLNFVNSGVGAPTVSGSMVQANMHISAFERVVDILRNEKPVNFLWASSWAGVYTGNEPVGEEEGVP